MVCSSEFIERVVKGEKDMKAFLPSDVWVGYSYFVDGVLTEYGNTNEKLVEKIIFSNILNKKTENIAALLRKKEDAIMEKPWDPGHSYVQFRKTFINTDKGMSRIVQKGNKLIGVATGFDNPYYDYKTILNLLIDFFNARFACDKIIGKNLFN